MTTAYGSITVSGLTDIADIYFEYSLAVSSANVTNDYPFTQAGELGWTVNGESRKTPPTWQSGYKIWVREVKIKTDVATKFYGNPYPDTAINQTNVDLEALQTKVKKMWSNSTGSYMASGIGNNDVDTATVSTYGFNSRTTTGGISFNYNAIPLTELGVSGLKLYIPTISNNTVTGSNLGVELTTSALKFYDPTYHKAAMVLTGSSLTFNKPNTTTAAAVLDSNGLVLSSGGIKAGTFNNQSSSNRFIYLSTGDYGSSITINGHSASNWRAIIGTKFGVDNEGNLYASNANISGAIVATSLSLGSGVTIPASTGISGLSTVATTGSYNDLNDTPTIPSLDGYIYVNGRIGDTPAEGATGFVVETGGLLKASNAMIYGTLYSSAGTIGGWTIKSNVLSSSTTSTTPGSGVVILSKGVAGPTSATGVLPANQTWAITASNQFGVTTTGKLYATGAEISGKIIVSSNSGSNVYTTDEVDDNFATQESIPTSVNELEDIGTYATKQEVTEVDNFVKSHIEIDGTTMSIVSDDTMAKLVMSTLGLSLYGKNGTILAEYGEDAIIGDPTGFHVRIVTTSDVDSENGIFFYNNTNPIAYISGDTLYITQSVVLQQMDVGEQVAKGGLGQWSWKVHEVDNQNNLYLKWLG